MEDISMDLKKLVKKELRTLIDKNSLTPSELDAAKKAVCLLKMLEDDYDMAEMAEDSDYSEASYRNPRGMRGMTSHGMRRSYGYPYRDWNEEMSYYPVRDYSNARGRDGRTGRYVSRDGRSYNRGRMSYGYGPDDEYMAGRRMVVSYDDGYSGHSIDDRIVDALEQMMDHAASDYEREKLNKVIRYVDSTRGQ